MTSTRENTLTSASARLDWFYLSVFCAGYLVIHFHIGDILTDRRLAGWDTTSHYFLFTQALEHFLSGEVSWYESLWSNGYPAFSLYAPLPYLFFGLPHLISFGLISEPLSFNLSLYLLIMGLFWSFGFVGGQAFGKEARPWCLLVGLLGLCHRSPNYDVGQNINNFLSAGLVTTLVGALLLMLSFGIFLRLARVGDRKTFFGAIVVSGLLSVSHILSAFFFFIFYLPLFFFSVEKNRLLIFLAALVGVLLGSFWWIDFLQHLWISSGKPIFSPGEISDPLGVLIPYVNSRFFEFVLYIIGGWEVPKDLYEYGLVEDLELSFILPALVFSILGLIGTVSALRMKRWSIVVPFLFLLFFIPRTWFIQNFDVALHQYRLMLPLFYWWLLLGGFGAYQLFLQIQERIPRQRTVALSLYGLILLALSVEITLRDFHVGITPPYFERSIRFLDETLFSKKAKKVLSVLEEQNPEGIVATEVHKFQSFRLGSPHFFSSEIPLQLGIPITPGLLAESSYSFNFSQAPLRVVTETLEWGRPTLSRNSYFSNQSLESMVERMRIYRIEYVIGTSKLLRRRLGRAKNADLVHFDKPISLFSLGSPKPILEISQSKPFLYIPRYGEKFLYFSEWLFANPQILEFPILYSRDDYLDVLQDDGPQFAGIILGFPEGAEITDSERNFWRNFPIAKIYLNVRGEQDNPDLQEFFVKRYFSKRKHRRFSKIIQKVSGKPRYLPANGFVTDDVMTINEQGGVRIRQSYAPRWESTTGKRVYLAYPSFMWVFSDGDETLEYR